MKLFKKRNIQALIYGLFMLLPLCAILGRVIYVQSNKNAYESYYGETINEVEYEQVTDVELFNDYYFINNAGTTQTITGEYIYKIQDFKNYNIPNINGSLQNAIDNGTIDNIRFSMYNGNLLLNIRLSDNSNLQNFNLTNDSLSFEFYLLTKPSGAPDIVKSKFYSPIYNQYSYLDNVFEYSISKFVDDNNFGNFDFFQWFSTFFLQDNAVNNLYVHFINWYMNYMLYVSLGYLIFSILMWFVNFFRSLVEKSTDLNL